MVDYADLSQGGFMKKKGKANRFTAIVLTGLALLGGSNFEIVSAADSERRDIQMNILQEFNTDFEGADEEGVPYWWNNSSWNSSTLTQKVYMSDEPRLNSSGNSYMEVVPEDNGVSAVQINNKDIAVLLESGSTYEFSFYAKAVSGTVNLEVLSHDNWASQQSATVIYDEPVELNDNWQFISGTFAMPENDAHKEVQLRLSGDNGMTFCLDDLKITALTDRGENKKIEKNIPSLKDTVSGAAGLGEDAYTGVALANDQINNQTLMELIEKHFNAVTFENELKMDAIFGYHNDVMPEEKFEEITWTRADGTTVTGTYPQMDFSLAEKMLDFVKAWNNKNPDNQIKVRGHVLVWHSQAPEWFFHQEWDKTKPYVSAEEMDVRQEWYIKQVLEHFLGQDSPYKDMFYGWDVVNEAVSDTSGTYRKDGDEKSCWWAVYKNESYIVNAFRYANYYAPETLELYYNDYNECSSSKIGGIEVLLKEIKSHENDIELPTRITGMGMQAHYDMISPTVNQFEAAVISYGEIVEKVQLTEFDLKASKGYDGTKAAQSDEYTKQAYRYKEIYDVLKDIDSMDGIDINGLTIWGVIDSLSWLQNSNNAGGGSDGSQQHVPLLFDDEYRAKPAFYAFVEPAKLEPFINNVVVMQALDGSDPYAKSNVYTIKDTDDSFQMIWEEEYLKVKVTVRDTQVQNTDSVTLYLDWDKTDGDTTTEKKTVFREDAQLTTDGYIAEFTVDKELAVGSNFAFDVLVTDGKSKAAFNDFKLSQESSSKYYAMATAKPYMSVSAGTVIVDGVADSIWNEVSAVPLTIEMGAVAEAQAKLLWDKSNLYLWMEVMDNELDKTSLESHEQDSVEVFLDENNGKTEEYEDDDKQYRINYMDEKSFNGIKCTAENVTSAVKVTDGGYIVEAAFKWTDITPKAGTEIGIELQINNGAGGTRIGTLSWFDESGMGWSSPRVFGTAFLTNEKTVA